MPAPTTLDDFPPESHSSTDIKRVRAAQREIAAGLARLHAESALFNAKAAGHPAQLLELLTALVAQLASAAEALAVRERGEQ